MFICFCVSTVLCFVLCLTIAVCQWSDFGFALQVGSGELWGQDGELYQMEGHQQYHRAESYRPN